MKEFFQEMYYGINNFWKDNKWSKVGLLGISLSIGTILYSSFYSLKESTSPESVRIYNNSINYLNQLKSSQIHVSVENILNENFRDSVASIVKSSESKVDSLSKLITAEEKEIAKKVESRREDLILLILGGFGISIISMIPFTIGCSKYFSNKYKTK